jgi:hypothetical protein
MSTLWHMNRPATILGYIDARNPRTGNVYLGVFILREEPSGKFVFLTVAPFMLKKNPNDPVRIPIPAFYKGQEPA